MSIYQRSLTIIGAFLALLSEQGPASAFVLAPGQTAASSGVVLSCTSTFDAQPKGNNGNSWGVKSSLASATNAAGEATSSADEAKRNLKEVLEKNSQRTQNGDVKSAIELNDVPACAQASQKNNEKNAYEHSEDGSDAPVLTEADLVPYTSRVVAVARAIESRRHDRLFNDYLAELLAGTEALQVYEEAMLEFAAVSAKGEKKAPAKTGDSDDGANQSADGTDESFTEDVSVSRGLAIRTKFGDDFFEDCTRPPRNIKQMVLLGAGMDTRGYRLRAGPDTTVFEVDQAVVLDFKTKILSGSSAKKLISDNRVDGVGEARVVSVKADFMQTGWEVGLLEAGFDPTLPSAWVLEGLIMYLEEDEVTKLVQIIPNLSSPGSAFCANVITGAWLEHMKKSDNEIFRSWTWGCDDPQSFFEGHFPSTWSIKCVMIGTPGVFPEGADYSMGFNGWGHAYVIGYAA